MNLGARILWMVYRIGVWFIAGLVFLQCAYRVPGLFEVPIAYPDNVWEYFVGTGLHFCSLGALVYLGYVVGKFKTHCSYKQLLIPTGIWLSVLLWEAFYDLRLLGPHTWEAQLDEDVARREFIDGLVGITINVLVFLIGPVVKIAEEYKHKSR